MVLEEITGEPPLGYRAPTYSITRKSLWALDILREEGFRYDSSLFPIHHDKGGLPGAKRYPYRIDNGPVTMWEFPISTTRLLKQNIPFSGGGYFRLLPYKFIKSSIETINREGHPAIVYLHPWEFDPGQPRINVGPVKAFRHYVNLAKTEDKLKRLLKDFSFMPFKTWLTEKR